MARWRQLWGSNGLARAGEVAEWADRVRFPWRKRAIMRRASMRRQYCGRGEGAKGLMIGLAATARGLAVANGSVQGIGVSAEVMRCRRPGDVVLWD